MKPSIRQEAIYKEWKDGDENILISACAGSGKTHTLMEMMNLNKGQSLFLAFNKSIQTEIQEKINEKGYSHAKALTLHSLGLRSIYSSKLWRRSKIDNNKGFEIASKVKNKHKKIFNFYPYKEHIKIFFTLIDLYDASRNFLTTNIEELKQHMISMDKIVFNFKTKLPPYNNHVDSSSFLKELWDSYIEEAKKYYNSSELVLDFTDMIFLPIYFNLEVVEHPEYLYLDECQDFNLCQHKFVDKLISQGSVKKWTAAGDKYQSIYGFAGSHSESFDLFLEKDNVISLPLDICYRCDSDIVGVANEVYPIMKGFKESKGIVGVENDINLIKSKSMIICRTTSPIIDIYFKLLEANKPCYIKGKDIMKSLMRFLKDYHNLSVEEAETAMSDELDKLIKEYKGVDNFEVYKMAENISNFKILSVSFQAKSVKDILSRIEELFKEKENAIILSTIHKSKGLEADVVYILDEHLIPHKMAASPQQLIQEQNLKYVARTRAKKELYFIDSKEL